MSRRMLLCLLVALFAVVVCSPSAEAKVTLPSIIGDNMVLQAGQPVTLWGWAGPGEKITIEAFLKNHAISADVDVPMRVDVVRTTADEQGRWKATLAKKEPGQALVMTITDGSGAKTTVDNILVGQVWLCSGQSNMDMSVGKSKDAKKEIAEAKWPEIRLFKVKREIAEKPKDNCTGRWVVCSPETIAGYTAVGYFFGRELFKDLEQPVGLIQSAWGGTPAEAWTSREALEAKPSLKPLLARWDKAIKEKKQVKSPHRPAGLYNAMIAPLLPYGIRGAIWYQGESNVGRAHQYRTVFPTMIADWRAKFDQPKLPFGFVQIAPYEYTKRKNRNDPRWCAELWEAQLLTLKGTPAVGMAVTTDIGNVKNIHPANKQEVGRRLALWALATVYGKDLIYSGPIYKSMAVEGNKIRLSFDHTGGGLASRDGKPLSHFTIAGEDMKFHPAVATIDGETIVVSSDQVSSPVAVRFAWHEMAEPNLMNKEGLPASPFRTDKEKCQTEGKH